MDKSKHAVVTVTGLSHDGRGIAHRDGKTIFIEGGLAGEELEIEYQKRRSRFDEAKIVTILAAAEHRKKPDCNFFSICGGCSLQHMDQQTQINHKQAVLLEQLRHIGNVFPRSVLPATIGPSYGYRRKARLGVRYVNKKGKLLIGFREKNGRYLADIESCSVLHPSVGEKIPTIRNFLLKLDSYLHIPQLEIAAGDDATALIIRHLVPLTQSDLVLIEEFARQQGFHIYLQPDGPETATLFFPNLQVPRLRYSLKEYGIEMLFHPTDFTQVNREINHKLIQLAIQLLAPTEEDILLDLFCGVGNFTLPLARYSKKVIGVEGSQAMVARGYENAAHNQVNNVEFLCQNLASDDARENWNALLITGILLDPPRAGALEILPQIINTFVKRIVYISCNPSTLARDAGILCRNGFELTSVAVLDMFPHTSHVESVALFNRV